MLVCIRLLLGAFKIDLLKLSNMNVRIVCVCFFIRNSPVSYEWFDDFAHDIYTIHTVKPHADLFCILGKL